MQTEKSGDATTARKLLNEALTHAKLVQTKSIMDVAHPYRKDHDDLVSDLTKSLADLPE